MSHDYILTNGTEISHFRIESRLGAGGMGEVYRVHDLTLERSAAMKVLSPEFLTDGDRVRRFVQEARSASALNHPNIVTIYEIGQVPVLKQTLGLEEEGEVSIHFIAMEFIDGHTLRSLAARGTETTKLLDVMAQVADGLAKAHGEGIVHRDLKPDNIMVTNDGYAKVVDFGLAKLTETKGRADQHRTASGVVMGTAAYMSPEQVQGLDIDQRSDIFSFGAILYELVCGRRPFQSDSSIDTMHRIVFSPHPSLQDIVPWLPESLRYVVDRCLEKEPENRYPDMKQVAVDLRQIIRQFEAGAIAPNVTPLTMERPMDRTPGSGGQRMSGPQSGSQSGSQSGARSGPYSGSYPGPRSGSGAQVPMSGPYSGRHSGGLSISGGFVGQPGSGPVSAGVAQLPKRRINVAAWIYRGFLAVLLILAGYLWYAWPDFAPVQALPLEETPAITKAKEDGPVVWEWLPLENISPALRRSVVAELDPDFFDPAVGTPEGNEILQKAARSAKLGEMPKRVVGMSPISRGAVRWGVIKPSGPLASVKAFAFAVGIERTISREDTLEVLLNTAEFGDGLYGVEAATQSYFQKAAKSLDPEEAAILAVYLAYPGETDIRNPDNMAVARRDRLVESLNKAKESGGE
jgi:serine/threonine protein kinase